jgi:predicted transcriptional regulator
VNAKSQNYMEEKQFTYTKYNIKLLMVNGKTNLRFLPQTCPVLYADHGCKYFCQTTE